MTRTYATLEISAAAYAEIRARLQLAGDPRYSEEVLVMDGIGLVAEETPAPCCQTILTVQEDKRIVTHQSDCPNTPGQAFEFLNLVDFIKKHQQ